jgi:hypothetical protein
MEFNGTFLQTQPSNVVNLFGDSQLVLQADPLENLLEEAYLLDDEQTICDEALEVIAPKTVSESHFPDQSLYVMDDQLKHLKQTVQRLKFYLGDLSDLVQR